MKGNPNPLLESCAITWGIGGGSKSLLRTFLGAQMSEIETVQELRPVPEISSRLEEVRTGIVKIVAHSDGVLLGAGTGFMIKGFLVTNNHVTAVEGNCNFSLKTLTGNSFTYSKADLNLKLVTGSTTDCHDYAIYAISDLAGLGLYEFEISDPDELNVGDDISFLGYPLNHDNLVVHRGWVSSKYLKGSTNIIQVDASVNNGNSGGPLLDLRNFCVAGIVTRKADGLSQAFKSMRHQIHTNIELLGRSGRAIMQIGGVDPVQAIQAGQHQMLRTMQEIERSANVGIGYAFSIKHLQDSGVFS